MPIGPARLSLLPFPQFWDGNSLTVRFLCLPKGDPLLTPPKAGMPVFAAANLVFEAKLIGGLRHLPVSGNSTPVGPLILEPPLDNKAALFAELPNQFNITGVRAPAGAKPQFRKAMTESYKALIGDRTRSRYLADSAEFACALHQGAQDQPDPVKLPDNVTWGRVLAFALRQPKLATGLGLVLQATVQPPTADFFSAGGWLYIDLHPTSDYAADPTLTAHYAARIPALTAQPRALFAPVLFPVTDAAGNFIADLVYREAEHYEDGLAKLVHCAQTDAGGDGIRLAWEDEQIAEWLNRQVDRDGAGELTIDSPIGVSGYRVDVRLQGAVDWHSLVAVKSVADLMLGPIPLGPFAGETILEVSPAQLSPKQPGAFWFPSYFATWRGASLALTDQNLIDLHARPDVRDPATPAHLLDREKNFISVDAGAVPLHYGKTYEFRVRMADLTRGGPEIGVQSPQPPGSSVAAVTFQRRKPPGPVNLLERPTAASRQVRIAKPRLGHPEILFTDKGFTFQNLLSDLDVLSADRTVTREIGLPDPDVLTLAIKIEVKALTGDAVPYLELYSTTRTFDADEMILKLDVQDHPTLASFSKNQPGDGPLVLPAARDLRLTFIAIGRDDAGYFAKPEFRSGAPVVLDVRAPAISESALLADPAEFPALRSFFFQPPPADGSVASPIERLGAELKLDRSGLTLTSAAGVRTVLACSSDLRHTLSPESSAVTFGSAADLVQRWINVVQFNMLREWTWDGLDPAGITVTRIVHAPDGDTVQPAGAILVPRTVGKKAIPLDRTDSRAPARQSTELIFFDAFDPKPTLPGKFPSELTIEYVLQPTLRDVPQPDPLRRDVLLPVVTPPKQVPRMVSAGLALSEYLSAPDYSSSEPRRRSLWFEFDRPPDDKEDAYFVRVRAIGPDPMLLAPDVILNDVVEDPLPLDPEWMRLITPGQPRDDSGLNAMQQAVDSAADLPTGSAHYLIPLPPHLTEASPELFGFFVYEVRVGHTDSRWCTAQGRFGPMLRIAGVQHPAPPLVCQAARGKTDILVRASFATPVLNGANVRPPFPITQIWALLYARVRQTDALAWRNILVTRVPLFPPQSADQSARVLYGEGLISLQPLANMLHSLGLGPDTPLTTLAMEMFADPPEFDPVGNRLGQARVLRTSPLVPVPDAC
jgi:hypothetical protein